jgi:hypothetical protein
MDAISVSLWLLFVLGYALAYVFGGWDEERTHRANRRLLRLTSAVLVVSAIWLWRRVAAGTTSEPVAVWIVVGMTCSFLGDLITGGIIPVRRAYLVAIGVFAAGHVGYLVAMAAARASLGIPLSLPGWWGGMAVGVVAWWGLIRRGGDWSLMSWLALGYALMLGSVLGIAFSMALYEPRIWPLALGATLFSTSDVLLGRREMRKRTWFMMNDTIWFLYIFGQFFIVWSVVRIVYAARAA